MNLEIVYKKSFGSNFPGLFVNSRYMERLNENKLYLLLGREKLLDLFFLDKGIETPIKNNKQLLKVTNKKINVIFKLSKQGKALMYRAYCQNGEYYFSFYDDNQNPWLNKAEKVNINSIEDGFHIEIGRLFNIWG